MAAIPVKIFIDGGEVEETKLASETLVKRFGKPLDGQTTNPSLIAKNLASRKTGKISENEALEEYKRIVQQMSKIIPKGSISIQVFANRQTTSGEMIKQARERVKWIPNASIKLPCTSQGLRAAGTLSNEMPINITLVFSQEQAAAVYEVSKKARYPIFISPFVGRLDDRGERGMDIIKNIVRMYEKGDGHVEVLTASVRNLEHILYAIYLKSDIITIPYKIFRLWADQNFPNPAETYIYKTENLQEIPYREDVLLGRNWQEYNLSHDLTDMGVDRFYSDWMEVAGRGV